MKIDELIQLVKSKSAKSFDVASDELENAIFSLPRENVIDLVLDIGIIPESIDHDSSEEKLFTKCSDIFFARSLSEMGLTVKVLKERSDCADIVAQSKYHTYSLVGDAKAFRLSRTAKNAKDFKVDSMYKWKGDSDFSVLACPYFQYPTKSSQIYKTALENNVSLFSWEYLYVAMVNNIRETSDRSLRNVWDISSQILTSTTGDKLKNCFINQQNDIYADLIGIEKKEFNDEFSNIKEKIIARGGMEIQFYENEIKRIKALSKEAAIRELLISKKLDSKVATINKFIESLK